MGYEPIGRIRPVAPAPSLLTSARPLPDGVNWTSGISWATSCILSGAQPFCPSGARDFPVDRTVVHSMPFAIYTPVLCDFPVDGADLEQLVEDATEVQTAANIADALWMGVDQYQAADTTQITLRRNAMDVSQSGPIDLDDGVATLLTHYQQCTGGAGGAVVHLPGSLLTYALGGGGSTSGGGARVCWPEGQYYRGPHGSTMVFGPGYPEGRTPAGPFGAGPALSTTTYQGNEMGAAWIYVTGPVEYAVTPVRVRPESEADRPIVFQNKYEIWGEREAIVRFDPCCVFATEVWNPAPMPEVS